jgi:HK97 gp10 family phage protein
MSNNVGNVTVKITGLKEVMQTLGEIGPKLARRSLRKALNAVGDYWVPEVQSRTPDVDGALRDSIAKKVTTRAVGKDSGDLTGTVEVGPELHAKRRDNKKSVGPGIYGMWVEFSLKTRKYLAHPFMRPTFDATADKAVEIFAKTLQDELEDAVKK